MKFYKIFRVFRVMSACADWFEKAMQDGVIDSNEAGNLVRVIGEILGFEVKLDVKPGK